MRKDLQLKIAIGLSAMAVVFVVEYAYFMGGGPVNKAADYMSPPGSEVGPGPEAPVPSGPEAMAQPRRADARRTSDFTPTGMDHPLAGADFIYFPVGSPASHAADQRIEELRARYRRFRIARVGPHIPDAVGMKLRFARAYGFEIESWDAGDRQLLVDSPALFGPRRAWVGAEEVETASLRGPHLSRGMRPYVRMVSDMNRPSIGGLEGKASRASGAGLARPEMKWDAVRIRAELPDADFLYVQTTCPSCRPANERVKQLEAENPNLKFVWVHPREVDTAALMDIMAGSYDLDDETRRTTMPVLYGPGKVWVGVKPVADATLDGNALTGPRPYERMGSSWEWLERDQSSSVARFKSFQWYMVGLAGLIDGINPCAISAIIFLLSYLTLSGMGRSSLKVGLLFAAGCFVAYLLIGLGLWRLSSMALGAVWGRRILYPAIAFLTLSVAILALTEMVELIRKGEAKTLLKLPNSWLLRVHEIIRRTAKAKHAMLLAAPMGIVVTLIEFGCTGQVYLPTMTYVASLPGQGFIVLPMLLLYNVAFILPLMAVIIVHSVTAGRLQKPRTPIPMKYVRLAEGLLLGAIGAFMLWATFYAWVA